MKEQACYIQINQITDIIKMNEDPEVKFGESQERTRDTQAYYQRIRSKIAPDGAQVFEAFKRWEFIPDSRISVQFFSSKCQVCNNRLLKYLFKIKIIEEFRYTLPPGWPDQYWVGSICVQHFCHRDEFGMPIAQDKRANFVVKMRNQKIKDIFLKSLDERIADVMSEDMRALPRLSNIIEQIRHKRSQNQRFTFQTVIDAMVVAVYLKFKNVKELTRYCCKIAKVKYIQFSLLDSIKGDELQFYLKLIKAYDQKKYRVIQIYREDYGVEERNHISSSHDSIEIA